MWTCYGIKTEKPGMVVHPSNPTPGRQRQKDQEFKIILYCITSNSSLGYMRPVKERGKKREKKGGGRGEREGAKE